MASSIQLDVKKFVANPGAPVITQVGAAGGASRSWKVVAVAADGSKSAASSAGSTTTGHATPDGTNFDRATWAAVPGAVSYEVFRTAGGATQGKIGTTVATSFDDTGFAGDASSPSSANGTGIGAWSDVLDMRDLAVQVDGGGSAFVATLQVQGRAHKSGEAVDIGAAVSAKALVAIAPKIVEVRVVMTAYTSGNPAAYVAGNGRA